MISASTNDQHREHDGLGRQHRDRLGTASSEARITPVEYSVVIVSTPSTQIAS